MGRYEKKYWVSDGWGMNRRETQSGPYYPYVPDKLADREIRFSAQCIAAISRAESAICVLNKGARYLTDTEPLARLILRSEALASSRIEGLEMSAGRLLEYEALDELGVSHRVDGTEASVINNIAALREGVEQARLAESLDVATICGINRRLLLNTSMADYAGVIRTEQNWIGGNNANPVGAAYVPPVPELVPELMEDLSEFCNTSALPALAIAALAHAQLETIHPFADGNGRTGRAFVHVILRRGDLADRVIPPVSLILATDKARYINNLMAFRTNEDDSRSPDADEAASNWVEYFSNACLLACERAESFEVKMSQLKSGWFQAVRPRGNSAADLLLEALTHVPVVSVESAARQIGRSQEAARLAIQALVDKGVLVQNARNRKSGIYVAKDVLSAFNAYERSLATLGGDTSVEKVARPVPQRLARGRHQNL